MRMGRWTLVLVWLAGGLLAGPAPARTRFDVEMGAAFGGYNDVRIPGDGGTDISFTDDLQTDPAFAWRVRLGHTVGDRQTLLLLVAPLRLHAEGSVGRDVSFDGTTFPANSPLEGRYRFDSYRLTYRYDFVRRASVRAGVGLTAKIRDAGIRLQSGATVAEKTNTGFVPLVNFLVDWSFAGRLGLRIEADALAAPQGRAEDVLVALRVHASDRVSVRAGYRLLEGGADNDEVYNFTLVNYAVAGATIRF